MFGKLRKLLTLPQRALVSDQCGGLRWRLAAHRVRSKSPLETRSRWRASNPMISLDERSCLPHLLTCARAESCDGAAPRPIILRPALIVQRTALDALAAAKTKRFFEYWGHEASLLPVDLHPLLRWRMARAERGVGTWGQLRVYAGEKRAQADALLERIRSEGPLAASDVEGERARKGMWAWSDAKHALEWLFWAGL